MMKSLRTNCVYERRPLYERLCPLQEWLEKKCFSKISGILIQERNRTIKSLV
jgi:hypothetical protein